MVIPDSGYSEGMFPDFEGVLNEMDKSKAASSFVVWLDADGVRDLNIVRGVTPRPADLRPTQHVSNHGVVAFALALAAVAVSSDEIMKVIDRVSKGKFSPKAAESTPVKKVPAKPVKKVAAKPKPVKKAAKKAAVKKVVKKAAKKSK